MGLEIVQRIWSYVELWAIKLIDLLSMFESTIRKTNKAKLLKILKGGLQY